jgi:hypothetical protein
MINLKIKTMNKEEFNLVATVALLPVLADLLEDFPMTREAKMNQTQVINTIRKFDRLFMRDASSLIGEQQVDIQIAFRQWLNKSYESTQIKCE